MDWEAYVDVCEEHNLSIIIWNVNAAMYIITSVYTCITLMHDV